MKDLVEVIAKALVDHPDEVVVTEKEDGRNVVVEQTFFKAIRSVVKAASSKENKIVDVEIV